MQERLIPSFVAEFRLYIVTPPRPKPGAYLLGCNDDAMWVAVKCLSPEQASTPAEPEALSRLAMEVGGEVYMLLHQEALTGPVRRWRMIDGPNPLIEQLLPERSGLLYAQLLREWIRSGDHRWGADLEDALALLSGQPIRRTVGVH